MHGDVLVKSLLKYSDKMKIRRQLAVELLFVFFNTLWKEKSESIQLEILKGPHREIA